MERVHPVVSHLYQQGYTRILQDAEGRYIEMFRKLRPPRYYPRFHLKIPLNIDGELNLSGIKLHLDERVHSSSLSLNTVRESTVSEIKCLAESFSDSTIQVESRRRLVSGLNGLLLFEAAEDLRNPKFLTVSPIDRFFRGMNGEWDIERRRYKRDANWRNALEEELPI